MERAYTGLTALVKINTQKIGYIDNASLNLDKDIIEISQFGAQYKEKKPSIKNWTSSAEGTVAFAAGESQHKLYQAFESGEFIELTFMLNESTTFTGSALVKSLEITEAAEDKANISVEFEGSGGIEFTLPITHEVTISSGVGGTTTPAGKVVVVTGQTLVINVTPSAGKAADEYFVNGGTPGTAIVANKVTLAAIAADTSVEITFKAAV